MIHLVHCTFWSTLQVQIFNSIAIKIIIYRINIQHQVEPDMDSEQLDTKTRNCRPNFFHPQVNRTEWRFNWFKRNEMMPNNQRHREHSPNFEFIFKWFHRKYHKWFLFDHCTCPCTFQWTKNCERKKLGFNLIKGEHCKP